MTKTPLDVSAAPAKPVLLALQGGGAYGAFAWGAIDYLLEHNLIDIAGVSGASAGAVNAALVTYALGEAAPGEGPATVRERLKKFWQDMARRGRGMPVSNPYGPNLIILPSWQQLARFVWSPNATNYLLDALRDHLPAIDGWQKPGVPPVLVNATDTMTGGEVHFTNGEISPEAVAASAALPPFGPLVQLDGRTLMDGGFSSNPPILPLIEAVPHVKDVLLIQLNPTAAAAPRVLEDVEKRRDQVMLNAALNKELQLIHATHPDVRLHKIELIPPTSWDETSKFNIASGHLDNLFAMGRRAAEEWHDAHGAKLGVATSSEPLLPVRGKPVIPPAPGGPAPKPRRPRMPGLFGIVQKVMPGSPAAPPQPPAP